MHANLYRVAFAIARHVAIERGRKNEGHTPREALHSGDAPRPAVQSLGGEGEQPTPLRGTQRRAGNDE